MEANRILILPKATFIGQERLDLVTRRGGRGLMGVAEVCVCVSVRAVKKEEFVNS